MEHEEHNDRSKILDELISLSERGEIKQTPKYLKKASYETLERIQAEYKRKQLEAVNKEITDILIGKYTDLVDVVANVDDVEGLKSDLMSNGLIREDLKRMISYVTPLLPYIGLIGGGVITTKYLWSSSKSRGEERERNERSEQSERSERSDQDDVVKQED